LPLIWDRVDEPTRQELGLNYGKYASIGDQERKKLSRELLELVSAISYIADEYRLLEIDEAIDNLLLAHRGFQNFYNEPPFARALQRIVGESGKIPSRINKKYVLALIEVFLTNGNGIAWNAEPIYTSLINLFDNNQALVAILSFNNEAIASKLQFSLCQTKYRDLLQMLKASVSQPAVHELIEYLETANIPFSQMHEDTRIKQKVGNWLKIAGW
jgi:hypothetical protein